MRRRPPSSRRHRLARDSGGAGRSALFAPLPGAGCVTSPPSRLNGRRRPLVRLIRAREMTTEEGAWGRVHGRCSVSRCIGGGSLPCLNFQGGLRGEGAFGIRNLIVAVNALFEVWVHRRCFFSWDLRVISHSRRLSWYSIYEKITKGRLRRSQLPCLVLSSRFRLSKLTIYYDNRT